MFNSATAQLLQSAPPVPGLDPQNIPALLNGHYASLVSARLSGSGDAPSDGESGWTLERIADSYELVTSLQTEGSIVEESNPFYQQEDLDRQVIECLSPAVRKGCDTPTKVLFSSRMPTSITRVQLHDLALRQIV